MGASFKMDPSPDGLSREDALFMAKAAEQAERYEEMVKYMKRIVQLCESGDEMSNANATGVEERNLISVGYKNMMSHRRTAHRTVQQFEDKEVKNNGPNVQLMKDYKENIAQEVYALIEEVERDVVQVFTEGAKKCEDAEVKVFFLKMQGDYNRYGAEISSGAKREEFKEKALKAYTAANETASGLKATNPIRLGLTLNFSVFYYEICDKKEEASQLAKNAFEDAIDHLDTLSEEEYKDSTLIMQLLKDNLTLWNESGADSGDDLQVEEVDA